jgi:hypothetical protein
MAVEKTIKVALAGCGTVGSGVADIVVHRGDALARRTGLRFEITRALVSNLHRERTAPLPKEVYTDDPADLARTDADMLVEVMGGTDTARTVVVDALGRGQPVVTANKALLALHGAEVYAAARTNETLCRVRGELRGRLAHRGRLASRPASQPTRHHPGDLQQHLQLHPLRHAPRRHGLRRRGGRSPTLRIR